jgi:hypothetical protein
VGLSWFERGQYSLYVTLSYLWFALGIINKKAVYMFVSALFAYVKFTSFPFLFVISITGMLNAKNATDLKQSMRFILVFSSIIALLFLSYLEFGATFSKPSRTQLGNSAPKIYRKSSTVYLRHPGISAYKEV